MELQTKNNIILVRTNKRCESFFIEFLFLACLSKKTLKKRNKNVKKTVPSQGAQNPKSTDVKYHGKNLAKSGDSGQFSWTNRIGEKNVEKT